MTSNDAVAAIDAVEANDAVVEIIAVVTKLAESANDADNADIAREDVIATDADCALIMLPLQFSAVVANDEDCA